MSSLIILFCGLMFTIPIDKFPSDTFRKAIDVIALFIAITSTVFVIGMSMLLRHSICLLQQQIHSSQHIHLQNSFVGHEHTKEECGKEEQILEEKTD